MEEFRREIPEECDQCGQPLHHKAIKILVEEVALNAYSTPSIEESDFYICGGCLQVLNRFYAMRTEELNEMYNELDSIGNFVRRDD